MAQTIKIPVAVFEKLQEAMTSIAISVSPYKSEFLAQMYRARASDLEGKGKSLHAIRKKFIAH